MLPYLTLVLLLGTVDVRSSRVDKLGRVVDVKSLDVATVSIFTHGKDNSRRDQPQPTEPARVIHLANAINRDGLTDDEGIQQCDIYLNDGREAKFVSRQLTCPRYGIMYDVVLRDQLNKRQFESSSNAEKPGEKDDQTDGVPTLQSLNLERIIGLAPWEAQMLRAKAKLDKSKLPLPYPSDMDVDAELEKDTYDCEAFQSWRLKSRTTRGKQVTWSVWIRLEAPVLEEGFRMSRISTTISEDIPGLDLHFSMSRLGELEDNAERFLPNMTQYPNDLDRSHLCSRQLNRYLFYILGKNNDGGSTSLLNEKIWKPILWRIVMWLFAGKTDPKIKDYFEPTECLYYRVTSPKSSYPPYPLLGACPRGAEWILY